MAAQEGLPINSPLIDIVSQKWRGWLQPSARWFYEVGYWSHHPDSDPGTFFDLEAHPSSVKIISRGVGGSHGEVSLHAKHVHDFFRAAEGGVSDYERWAINPYPVGGRTVLLRMDAYWDEENDRPGYIPDDEKGMLCIDPDTHPSTGRLFLGDPLQELQQLGALIRARGQVLHLLECAKLTGGQLSEAAERARLIRGKAGVCFMPTDGICSCCESDVTLALAEIEEEASITGCPLCGYSWCE